MPLIGKKTTLHLEIEGMTCGSCVKHVTEALESVRGVKDAQVDLEQRTATVVAKADTDVTALIGAVAEAGYTATPVA